MGYVSPPSQVLVISKPQPVTPRAPPSPTILQPTRTTPEAPQNHTPEPARPPPPRPGAPVRPTPPTPQPVDPTGGSAGSSPQSPPAPHAPSLPQNESFERVIFGSSPTSPQELGAGGVDEDPFGSSPFGAPPSLPDNCPVSPPYAPQSPHSRTSYPAYISGRFFNAKGKIMSVIIF